MIFRIDLKIFLFFILFYFTKQIKLYVIILFFALIHEVGHLVVGIACKMKINKVTIMPLGLSIEFKTCDFSKEIKKLIVAIAGPITNIFIIVLVRILNIQKNIDIIIYSNLIIAIFNLLPIYPLDGGRILKSILTMIFNQKRATIYIAYISNIALFMASFVFSILVYYLKNIAFVFIIVYIWYIVFKQNKVLRVRKKIYRLIN